MVSTMMKYTNTISSHESLVRCQTKWMAHFELWTIQSNSPPPNSSLLLRILTQIIPSIQFMVQFNESHIKLGRFFYSTKWCCPNKNDSLKIPLEVNLCKIKYFLTADFISIRLCLTMNLCSCKLVEYKIENWMSGKSTFFTDPEGIYENELNVIFCLLITLTSSWWTKFCWTSRLGSIQ